MIDNIRIGAFDYTVAKVDKIFEDQDRKYYGDIDYFETKIQILNEVTGYVEKQTLWHEILHGIFRNAGQRKACNNEPLIDCIAYGLVQVMRDNPDLVRYMLDETS